jgi:phage/plasmid-associated DNA primase
MPKLNGFDYSEFQKFLTNKCGPQYLKSVYGKIFKPQYKCLYTKSKEVCWFKFDNKTTLWKHEKHEIIVDEVFKCLDKLFTETYELLGEDDPRRKQVSQARVKLGDNLADKLTERLMISFYDPDFQMVLDKTVEVFNFKNGLLDLKTMEFRKRTSDDMYTKCLQFDYDVKIRKQLKEEIKYIKSLLLKVCNNKKEDRNYLLQNGAYGLTGRNDLKGMLFMYGPKSNNGKSTYVRMLNESMPCYCQKISAKSFSSGKEHKFLMDALGLRISTIEELDKCSKQDTGLFKEVIDGDSIKLELLYSNSTIDFKPNFNLFVTCNTIPHFVTNDEGVKNRSNYQKFDNQFLQDVEDCPQKGIYKADTSIRDKLKNDPKIQQAIIYMMLDEIKKFYENDCKLPEMRKEQQELSNEIKNVGDYFKEFIEEYFEKTDIVTDKISKTYIRELYNNYSHNYGIKPSGDTYIRDNMERFGFTYKRTLRSNGEKGVFIGIKQIKDDENIFLVDDSEEEVIEKVVIKKQTIDDVLNEDFLIIKNMFPFLTKAKKEIKKKPKSNLDMDFDDIIDCSEQLEMNI